MSLCTHYTGAADVPDSSVELTHVRITPCPHTHTHTWAYALCNNQTQVQAGCYGAQTISWAVSGAVFFGGSVADVAAIACALLLDSER
jgi:hypothetical protein